MALVEKRYLGDGAYGEINDDLELVITTENGIEETNRVVLGIHELHALKSLLEAGQARVQTLTQELKAQDHA